MVQIEQSWVRKEQKCGEHGEVVNAAGLSES